MQVCRFAGSKVKNLSFQVLLTSFALIIASSFGFSQNVSFSGAGSYFDPTIYEFTNEFGSGLRVKRGQTITNKITWYDENGSSIANADPNNVAVGSTVRRVIVVKQKSQTTSLEG